MKKLKKVLQISTKDITREQWLEKVAKEEGVSYQEAAILDEKQNKLFEENLKNNLRYQAYKLSRGENAPEEKAVITWKEYKFTDNVIEIIHSFGGDLRIMYIKWKFLLSSFSPALITADVEIAGLATF